LGGLYEPNSPSTMKEFQWPFFEFWVPQSQEIERVLTILSARFSLLKLNEG